MALNLPRSSGEARNSPLYPMNFYMCYFCGHVFNSDFDYAKVPYREDNNLMYNQGSNWQVHLGYLAKLLLRYPVRNRTIIDIGAGDGEFLDIVDQLSLSEGVGNRCIAFEPSMQSELCRANGLEVYADYFIPQRDMQKFKPNVLICRHVLEHLQDPRDFVAEIAYYANMNQIYPLFLVEVPCITKALGTNRITDFLYEHVSNFTQRSLQVMFESVGWETYEQFLAYNDEVAVWVGQARPFDSTFEKQTKVFQRYTWNSVRNVCMELATRKEAGATIAFWGGTGKGAAFLNAYHLNDDRVVDSDIHKVGRFVPGSGQEIEHADALLESPVDVIVITTRWRAADIYNEIKRKGITYDEILVLDGFYLKAYTEEMYNEENSINTR
jgi:hypothetical protein